MFFNLDIMDPNFKNQVQIAYTKFAGYRYDAVCERVVWAFLNAIGYSGGPFNAPIYTFTEFIQSLDGGRGSGDVELLSTVAKEILYINKLFPRLNGEEPVSHFGAIAAGVDEFVKNGDEVQKEEYENIPPYLNLDRFSELVMFRLQFKTPGRQELFAICDESNFKGCAERILYLGDAYRQVFTMFHEERATLGIEQELEVMLLMVAPLMEFMTPLLRSYNGDNPDTAEYAMMLSNVIGTVNSDRFNIPNHLNYSRRMAAFCFIAMSFLVYMQEHNTTEIELSTAN